ncbi:Uncharacterized protein APZ42_003973 [Daphnia magna]|uniref:Uncharacterized protein n=1 Tax=Daphnia magna TaxID=35525 RepID=A0A164HBL7_9CRUS|nr:Uncharacterized protein APZ42_003973 [Daphnia magna]
MTMQTVFQEIHYQLHRELKMIAVSSCEPSPPLAMIKSNPQDYCNGSKSRSSRANHNGLRKVLYLNLTQAVVQKLHRSGGPWTVDEPYIGSYALNICQQ